MSALIGALRVSLSMDSAAFEKGAGLAEKRIAGMSRKMQSVAGTMASLGAKMSIGVTAPLTAFGVSAFKAATDAAELQSAFDQTFGSMAGSMSKWAEETGNALSRSTTEIQQAANTFGIFFNTAADPAKAAQMSRTFAVLAEDLGSFFNVDTDTAIEKLRAGLAGEAEPLRAFGVFLNEAAVKAKAMELGLTGVNGKLTEGEKIQARYALIMEATTKAQGDVVRTSAGTANQLRSAKAAFQELQVVVGTKLLPVLTPLITRIADAINWFTQLPKPVQNVALAITAVSAVTGPFLIGFASVINIITKIGPLMTALTAAWTALKVAFVAARVAAIATLPALTPFLIPLGALAVAVGAVYLAWKNWDKIKAIVGNMVTGVTNWLMKLRAPFDWVVGKAKAVGDAFFRLYDRVVGHSYVPDMVDEIGEHMGRLDQNMVQPAAAATEKTAQLFAQMTQKARTPFQEWAASIPQTAQQINETLQTIAVKGLDGFSDAMTDALMGTRSLKEAFHELAASVLRDLLQMTIKMMLLKALQAAFGGSFGGGGTPDIAGARAAGGPVMAGSAYLVGERGPELFMPNSSGSIVPNDALGGGGMSLTFHNDFRGADPSAVAAIQVRLNQMEAEIPSKVIATMSDARDRFVWRGQ